MVDSLNAKNQDLTLQNQKLRQEIYRFAQSAIALNSLVDPSPAAVNSPRATPAAATRTRPDPPETANLHPSPEEAATAADIAARLRSPDSASEFEELFTEVPEHAHLPAEKKPRDLGGLWLTITILLIMVTAFGAGFLLVRPLLPTSNHTNK
jgi:uncharacterized membrane protein